MVVEGETHRFKEISKKLISQLQCIHLVWILIQTNTSYKEKTCMKNWEFELYRSDIKELTLHEMCD